MTYDSGLKFVDLWIRIPRFPSGSMNYDSIDDLLKTNGINQLIKLDQRSLLRNKLRFMRACINVNVSEPLTTYAEIKRASDKVFGYMVWFEDFSEGCAFWGDEFHVIDKCPLLSVPHKDVRIILQKVPKFCSPPSKDSHNSCYAAQDDPQAQSTYVVHAKPK